MLKTLEMIRLDATGLIRPLPVIQTRRILKTMEIGDILEVRANDETSVRDLPAYCATTGHHLLMVREDEDDVVIFEIEKGA